MNRRHGLLAALLLALLAASAARAEEVIMVRSTQAFPEAMASLQQIIQHHGYKLARVQRVDVGLTGKGYQTAEYRLVYFAKPDEMTAIADRHPELLPYLPLKITIFAEGDSTLALSNNPELLGEYFVAPDLKNTLRRWERDVRSILEQLSKE